MRLFVFGLCCVSCVATAPPVRSAPPGADTYGDGVDWQATGDEVVTLLQGYLQVDTVNPPGNELRGAEYLKAALERDGIAAHIVEFEPGRANLVARLEATKPSGEKPLCLLSHLDVVTSEADQWEHPPLSGELAGGPDGGSEPMVWGRGALDMKGMGIVELETLVLLKRMKVPLDRDVVLLAVAGEEIGNQGMKALVKGDAWPGCGHLINEGGLGLRDALIPGQTAFAISVAEKGVLWLRLRAKGEAGHGSTPMPGRAPMELLKAAAALMAREPKPRVHPSLYELLRRAGEQKGGVSGFVMQRPGLVDLLLEKRLMSKPTTRATMTDTCQVTGYVGVGSAPNVIPSEVTANIDCRVLPGTSPDTLLAELKERIKDVQGVTLEVVSKEEANESTWDDEVFASLARNAVRGRPDAVSGPVLSVGYTDSLVARPLGTRAYGFVPFEVSAEELATMHGKNERVSVANLKRGAEVLFRAVVDVVVP
ncbi:MAG: M20/M25/M40 family metallo-hydrolase [Myxococcaceae bacterium]|nr:M20/M25/M40 family metallo-hydrolase [Myxococcaceae bacterium]